MAFSIWHSALTARQPATPAKTLSLYLLGHRIGTEQYSTDGSTLTAHFEYLDRQTTIALDTTLSFAKDLTPLSFESHGRSYRVFPVDASVPKGPASRATFTLEGMAPLSAQALLIRYWLEQGRPPAITVLPSGDAVTIREITTPTVATHAGLPTLREFTVDGVVWGRQRIWLTAAELDVAAAVTTAGVLPFEAASAPFARMVDVFARAAIRARIAEAESEARAVPPMRQGTFALSGGRLVDGSGAPPIERSVVIVRDGRIDAAGPASDVRVPRGVPVVDVRGKTILPGLWDMHAHVGIAEWGPVYLASGVTTAREMGGEMDVVTALRDAWQRGTAVGPRLLLAGLVDGPGPASFGHMTAANPDEGRSIAARYKAAGFQQVKLYSLLDRPTAAAIIGIAHAAGMTVTGHIPGGLSLREGIEMGMDHVAHLGVRDAPGSDALRETIAFLKARGTVIDPTLSWNELLGRSAQTPVASLVPGVAHVAPPLRRMLERANGGSVTPQQARERLERSLKIVKALHDAGVPIVAGTDKGVPGVSVAREIELYVEAGLSPMDAIRAATAVPAKVMGLSNETGTIRPGLRAELIVVDGNPLARISDIRRVALVAAGGKLYDAARLWRPGGFIP